MSRINHRVGRNKRLDKPILRHPRDSALLLSPVPDWAADGANPELQQELERCLKLRDGASRILPLAQNRLQQLDALKTLFVTNERVLLCLQRVQREKVEDALSANQSLDSSASGENSHSQSETAAVVVRSRHHAQAGLAKLCLSDIRIPLLWRDGPLGVNMQIFLQRLIPQTQSLLVTASLLAGSGDSADRSDTGEQCDGYAVFCLARLGHTIRETRLIFDIQPGTSDVEFDDKLTFDNVTEDFRLVFEIYAFPPSILARSASVFSRCRTLLMDSTRRNLDMLDSAQATGKGSFSFSSVFELIGRCTVTSNDLIDQIRAHTLATGLHLLLSSQTTSPSGVTNLLSTAVSSGPNGDLEVNGSETNGLDPSLDVMTHDATRSNGVQPVTATTRIDNSLGVSSERGLPLFGSVCFRIVAQPHSVQKPLHTGWLWIRKLTASPAQSPACLYWCELRDRHLWAYSVVESLRRDLSRISESKMAEDESVAAEMESVHIGTTADGVDDRRDSRPRIILDNNSIEQFQTLQDSLPVVNELCVKQSPEQIETGPQQLVSSTPQMTLQSPPQFGMPPPSHALHRRVIVPQQLNGAQSVTPNGSSRILKLVLAITPKTLFLDSAPTLRPISVRLLEDTEMLITPTRSDCSEKQSPPQQPPVRCRSSSANTEQPTQLSFGGVQPPSGSSRNLLFTSPKAVRKMRNIKAQAKSRSLTNVKQLSSFVDFGDLDPALQTVPGCGSSMTLPTRGSARPSLEDNLPWFTDSKAHRTRSKEPSPPSPSDVMRDNLISAGRLSSSLDFVFSAPKSKPMCNKASASETLPRFRRKKHREVTLNRLSRSLDTLCKTSCFTGSPEARRQDGNNVGTECMTDADSVASEPVQELGVVFGYPVVEPPQSSGKQFSLYTFRIATTSRVLSKTGNLISSPPAGEAIPDRLTLGRCVTSSEVFEFGVSKPDLRNVLRSAVPCEADDPASFANEIGTEYWLTMFKAHVTEQSSWGPDAFSDTVRIPEVHLTARDAGTRRSLAFF